MNNKMQLLTLTCTDILFLKSFHFFTAWVIHDIHKYWIHVYVTGKVLSEIIDKNFHIIEDI